MTSHVNLRPFHASSNSSSSSLSSASINSDSCSTSFASLSSSSSSPPTSSSSSLSSSSCCTHLTHTPDHMALHHRLILQNISSNNRNQCNSCNSHTLECLYASLSIAANAKRDKNKTSLFINNNCQCNVHCNNVCPSISLTPPSPSSPTTCHCFNSNISCDMINNLQSTLINSNNYRIPVKSEPNKINSPSITHKSDGERFTLNGQVTCVPEQSKLNVSPRVATVIEANSDSCQMNQLINENKQLRCIKKSQALELNAQRLTLQEQRSHIAILEQALLITESSVEQLKAKLASIQK